MTRKSKISIEFSGILRNLTEQYYIERIKSEIDFARFLAERNKNSEWRKLVDEAEKLSVEAILSTKVDLSKIVEEIEKILQPLAKEAKKYAIYCVGHAHIDMNWMWSYPETVAVTNDTFRTVLNLLNEFEQFKFSQSQASVYQIIERHNPKMLESIKEQIMRGKWEVTASHWVENDNNLVSGESLCRHILYTRKYMKELFGLEAEDVPINWAPDTFGHAATIPLYLNEAGIKYMFLHRPGNKTAKKHQVFWWEGKGGARVLVKNAMKTGYNYSLRPKMLLDYFLDYVNETGLEFGCVVYGVGDHGGGPTRRDILLGLDMQDWLIFPEIRFSGAIDYFRRLEVVENTLPIIQGELNFEFCGCYTSQSLIKRSVNYAECAILDAEKSALFAKFAKYGFEYDKKLFESSWRNILFMHFHDILPGSGVHDTRTYCHGKYQDTVADLGIVSTEALRHIAEEVDTSRFAGENYISLPLYFEYPQGAGVGFSTADGCLSKSSGVNTVGVYPFVIFNLTQKHRKELVEFVIWDNLFWSNLGKEHIDKKDFVLISSEGERKPCQRIDSGIYWGHHFIRLVAEVDVEAFSYATYAVCEGESPKMSFDGAKLTVPKHHCFCSMNERAIEGIENEYLRLEIDMNTGGIRSLLDKRSMKEICGEGGNPILEYIVERPHHMSSWLVDNWMEKEFPKLLSVVRKHEGPLKATLELKFAVSSSEIVLTYSLHSGDPQVYISLHVIWFEKGSAQSGVPALNFVLPLNLKETKIEYGIPFGGIDRSYLNKGEEVPALNWAKISGKVDESLLGILVVNDCKHGYSFDGKALRISLIRSSYEPDILPEVGTHEVKIGLRIFEGDISTSEAILLTTNFKHELKIVSTGIHGGSLEQKMNFIFLESSRIVMSGAKEAENDQGVILRFFNPCESPETLKVEFNRKVFRQLISVEEVDLMERPKKDKSIKIEGNGFTDRFGGYKLKTYLLKFSRN